MRTAVGQEEEQEGWLAALLQTSRHKNSRAFVPADQDGFSLASDWRAAVGRQAGLTGLVAPAGLAPAGSAP